MTRSPTATAVALVTLSLAAAAASAQSSVTIYGKVDTGLGKSIGSHDKAVQEQAVGNSRLGFRGVEDLGGGYAALFGFEHRFRPDTGGEGVPGRFYQGYSTVGLRTPLGSLNLGRQYTPAFSLVQNVLDPFGGITVVNLRDVGMRPAGSGIAKVRISDSVRYDYSANGLSVAASVAESLQDGVQGTDRPWGFAASYAFGKASIAFGYEDPQAADDRLASIGGAYTLGDATVTAGYSNGRTAADAAARGWLLGLTYRVGAGEIKAGYAAAKVAGTTTASRVGIGYHHWLSKRTKLYSNLGHERKIARERTGYDFGIETNF